MAINYPKLMKDLEAERKKIQVEVEKAKEGLEKAKIKASECAAKLADLRFKNAQLKTIQDNLPEEPEVIDEAESQTGASDVAVPKKTKDGKIVELMTDEEREEWEKENEPTPS